MRKRLRNKNEKINNVIVQAVNEALDVKFQSILHDIEYRLDCLYTKTTESITGTIGKLGSRDLNLSKHQLDGYTIADNSPIAGSIAWAACNVVYKGINHSITDGNSALKYIYWTLAQIDKTVFLTSATKPVLTEDDVLIFINEAGTHSTIMDGYRSGAATLDGTIGSTEIKTAGIASLNIANDAVTTNHIIAGAVTATELGTGAVTTAKILAGNIDAAALATGAVTSVKIGAGAVVAAGLGAGAVTATAIGTGAITTAKILAGNVTATELGTGAVTSAKIGAGAVLAAGLGAGAVTATAIGTGAITTAKISAGAVTATEIGALAVTASKIAANTITAGQIAPNTITSTQIGAGAIASDRLNTALHMLF